MLQFEQNVKSMLLWNGCTHPCACTSKLLISQKFCFLLNLSCVLTLFPFSLSHSWDETTLPANSTSGLYDSPNSQLLLRTSQLSHFLPAHPNNEKEWEVEIHSVLLKLNNMQMFRSLVIQRVASHKVF